SACRKGGSGGPSGSPQVPDRSLSSSPAAAHHRMSVQGCVGQSPQPSLGTLAMPYTPWWGSGVAFGSLWEPSEAFGSLWEPLGAFGSLWEPLEDFESLWEPLEDFVSLREPMEAFESLQDPPEAFGSLWEPLGAFGSLWEPLEDFGSLWEPSEDFGSLWEPLEAFGSLWEPLAALLWPGSVGWLWKGQWAARTPSNCCPCPSCSPHGLASARHCGSPMG
uniref:Uncharacterized protein n=1 Tax=Zosterops lateralis melanops TaxID=1220523 RepID=A0A8D2PCC8_ZOSLA